MRTLHFILVYLALSVASFAMDQLTIGVSRVMEIPTSDTQEMTLEHEESREILNVDRVIVLGDSEFKEMSLVEGNEIVILITLTDAGSKKLSELTREMVGKRIAITSNNRLLSAPVVKQQITGNSIEVTGNLTKERAEELIALFRGGKGG